MGNFTYLYNTARLTLSGHLYTFADLFKGWNLGAVTCSSHSLTQGSPALLVPFVPEKSQSSTPQNKHFRLFLTSKLSQSNFLTTCLPLTVGSESGCLCIFCHYYILKSEGKRNSSLSIHWAFTLVCNSTDANLNCLKHFFSLFLCSKMDQTWI